MPGDRKSRLPHWVKIYVDPLETFQINVRLNGWIRTGYLQPGTGSPRLLNDWDRKSIGFHVVNEFVSELPGIVDAIHRHKTSFANRDSADGRRQSLCQTLSVVEQQIFAREAILTMSVGGPQQRLTRSPSRTGQNSSRVPDPVMELYRRFLQKPPPDWLRFQAVIQELRMRSESVFGIQPHSQEVVESFVSELAALTLLQVAAKRIQLLETQLHKSIPQDMRLQFLKTAMAMMNNLRFPAVSSQLDYREL